jgi:hypothetical protein
LYEHLTFRGGASRGTGVLDTMESILTASASGHVVELSSTAGRPAAVPLSDAP